MEASEDRMQKTLAASLNGITRCFISRCIHTYACIVNFNQRFFDTIKFIAYFLVVSLKQKREKEETSRFLNALNYIQVSISTSEQRRYDCGRCANKGRSVEVENTVSGSFFKILI